MLTAFLLQRMELLILGLEPLLAKCAYYLYHNVYIICIALWGLVEQGEQERLGEEEGGQ